MAGDRLFHVGAVLQPAHARFLMSVKRNVEKVVVDEPPACMALKICRMRRRSKCGMVPAPVSRCSTGLAMTLLTALMLGHWVPQPAHTPVGAKALVCN